jgi:mRNA-degrading endonuclease RelE of RelBE toxin-antitoxin system
LKSLRAYERRKVVDAVDVQLTDQPTTETRNRKRLRPNPLAPWELRIGSLRVLYDVADAERKVIVIAIGKKKGNRLQIAGEDVEL